MHLLPGVTAIALAAIAVLCRGASIDAPRTVRPRAPHRLVPLAGAATVALVLAIGGASLLRAELTGLYVNEARAELAADPAAAIQDAGRALRLDAANLDAYYIKAAGLARYDRASEARATLLDAAGQDPANFVSWTLLGDLEVRAGHLREAKVYYDRALSLDRNDPSLSALAADPARGLSGVPPS
jgi:tetratricopeptide (TPR) repeat protein